MRWFSATEYDDLRGSTVSCEIVDRLCTSAIQWRMPAESQTEHLTEIAAILAAGLLRLQRRKSSPNLQAARDSSLDCERHSRGDVAGKVEVSRP